MLKPKWKTIGYCTGCQKPCFLNDGPKYWEIGTMCQCQALLDRGHPVFNLKKIGFTTSLIIAVFLTNDPFLRMVELFFLMIAIVMTFFHLEGWMMVKFSEGHHPNQYELKTVYFIDPDTVQVVAVSNYENPQGVDNGNY